MSKMSGTILLYIFEIHIFFKRVSNYIPYDGRERLQIPLDVRVKEQKMTGGMIKEGKARRAGLIGLVLLCLFFIIYIFVGSFMA